MGWSGTTRRNDGAFTRRGRVSMRITARGLNRATLARQMLLRREPLDVPEAVRRAVALQAQEPASPYLGLWNRVHDFDPVALDAAFADGAVVKSNMVRLTLHATHVDDFPAFREATEPTVRGARLGDKRFTVTGMSPAEADALVPELLDQARQPLTADELRAWLEGRLGGEPHK